MLLILPDIDKDKVQNIKCILESLIAEGYKELGIYDFSYVATQLAKACINLTDMDGEPIAVGDQVKTITGVSGIFECVYFGSTKIAIKVNGDTIHISNPSLVRKVNATSTVPITDGNQ